MLDTTNKLYPIDFDYGAFINERRRTIFSEETYLSPSVQLKNRKTYDVKDFRPSDKFDNPYLTIPRVTSNNSEHLCALVSGTCFRVLGTLLYLHEYCSYITYYCFFCQSFIIILQKLIYKKEILKLSILPFNAPLDYVFCLDLKIYDHKVIF